jgi:transcriptional regulator with XRE-family HTH domain
MDKIRLGKELQKLRENAKISQSELAKSLPFTGSRISRLESGELVIDIDEAIQIAKAIKTDEADRYADYLNWDWHILESPNFSHPNLNTLWQIEQSVLRLDELRNDPELKNAFLKQVELCREELLKSARFLQSTEHAIAFFGSPGVGKTTAICGIANGLRDHSEADLNKQMALQTGSGRTTICEVHIRNGGDYSISIEPCSEEELQYHISDFCDYLKNISIKNINIDQKDGYGVSAEMERTLRNMTELTIKKIKKPDGKFERFDPAIELVNAYPNKDELIVQIFSRLNSAKRRRTSIVYPNVSSTPAMKWLSKTFAEINFGRHPEFSVPKRIEVTVPVPILDSNQLNIRMVDTRGIDEPSAPRRDLQAFLDDERTFVVFCSRFEDAPSAAIQALLERVTEGGTHISVLSRSLLLILPKDGEEKSVLSEMTGEPVGDPEEGRQIRLEQIQSTTLTNLGMRNLEIEFLNVRENADCLRMKDYLVFAINKLRTNVALKAESLIQTVENLIVNKANEQVRMTFEIATKPIRNWLSNNGTIPGKIQYINKSLQEEIDTIRYVSSLRASIVRRGNWHNFDYWHGLGFGARRNTVNLINKQLTELKGIITNNLNDKDLEPAHGFLKQFLSKVDETIGDFYIDVQQLGETTFSKSLKSDYEYWKKCEDRWGMGSGYRTEIRNRTDEWFSNENRRSSHEFLESEIQSRWEQILLSLKQYIESPQNTAG